MTAQEGPRATTVLIVDDEEDMRRVVRAIIELANEGLSVAGEAADGEAAVELCRLARPDIVLLDHRMPGVTGIDTARRILAERPEQVIALFTAYLDRDLTAEAGRAGIVACLSKGDLTDLPGVLRVLAAQ